MPNRYLPFLQSIIENNKLPISVQRTALVSFGKKCCCWLVFTVIGKMILVSRTVAIDKLPVILSLLDHKDSSMVCNAMGMSE